MMDQMNKMMETAMNNLGRGVALGLILLFTFARPALPHSLEEVEKDLLQKEEYYQPIDKEAPGFSLENADGKTVDLADFRGKIVVLHFIYTNCADSCPLHAEKIAEIQKMINITPMKNQVEFISITTDPGRDRGQVLRDFGENHGLDPVNWMFLTTAPAQPEDTTRNLAGLYGAPVKLEADGEQMHGVVTSVIDQAGHLRARFHTLKFQSLNLVVFLDELVESYYRGHRGQSSQGFWSWLSGWF